MSTNDLPEIIRERRINELRGDIETLRTMDEGTVMPHDDREMTERRRARYVREAEQCLAVAERTDAETLFRTCGDRPYLFVDGLMAD